MGRVFRVWRGDWKKNEQQQWHFVPTHQDYGFTIYMDPPETFEFIDATVRKHYVLGERTLVVITYDMPDWMLFPGGQSPPLTISTTNDLLSLINRRPELSDITLLVMFGAKTVAEFQFLCRSDFTLGSTTYVVNGAQDEQAKARYEGLVFGERLKTSERVMNEIFAEEEMLIFHRVALEMGYADRVFGSRRQGGPAVGQALEIIQLDDDDEMVDVTHVGRESNVAGGPSEGTMIPFQSQVVAPVRASDAPFVLWDVGVDLFDYPDFYNAQKDGSHLLSDVEFWNGLMEDCAEGGGDVCRIDKDEEMGLGLRVEEPTFGVKIGTGVENNSMGGRADEDGQSSTGSTAILSAQPIVTEVEDIRMNQRLLHMKCVGGGVVDGPAQKFKEKVSTPLWAPTLKLSLGCGSAGGDAGKMPAGPLPNSSSEGSESDGGF
ncbi:hypothetical protein N665_0098s0060 [Sinapis alba]|nr:hypothetical protein N665_0098s0060 [Sinapis alba]